MDGCLLRRIHLIGGSIVQLRARRRGPRVREYHQPIRADRLRSLLHLIFLPKIRPPWPAMVANCATEDIHFDHPRFRAHYISESKMDEYWGNRAVEK